MNNKVNSFIPPHPLKTAVLFLVFNRLETTRQVFAAIRKAKPPRLYIAADGARADKESEDEKVKEVREYVMSHIDWACEVKTLFRYKNLGCKYAVSGAIDWFFSNEEMGIILEDDCLPSQSFFWYCEELLERYKDNTQIMHIGGFPYVKGKDINDESYYFSQYSMVWGWATWKQAWEKYDVDMKIWPKIKENKIHFNMFCNFYEAQFREKIWDLVYNREIDTWDYQWLFAIRLQSGIAILPKKNLIINLGFNDEATHTKKQPKNHFPDLHEINMPLVHPDYIVIDRNWDSLYFNTFKYYYWRYFGRFINIWKSLIKLITNKFVASNILF